MFFGFHPPKGYLKMNADVGFKDGSTTLVVLAKDEIGMVQGLWF